MDADPVRARLFWTVVCAVSVSGCVSVTRRDATEELHLASDPPGATVTSTVIPKCGGAPCPTFDHVPRSIEPAQGKPVAGPSCVTPCFITVRREDEFLLTFNLHGYQSEIITSGVRTSPDGASASPNFFGAEMSAEFALRGSEPPWSLVGRQVDTFVAASDRAHKKWSKENPAAAAAADEQIYDDLLEFLEGRKKSN